MRQRRRRQAVLLRARHLAECARMAVDLAVGKEHRIIAEARIAARRPHQRTLDPALELLQMAVRPGEAERAHEACLALKWLAATARRKLALDARHRGGEILTWARPARGVNPGRTVERIDREAGIVREGHALRCHCGGLRLDPRIVAEACAGLGGLGKPKLAGRYRRDAE